MSTQAVSGIEKLTPRKVARLAKPGRHSDGGGLYLQITSRGTKSWIFRYAYRGSEHYMGLGALHTVSLDEARVAARHARSRLAQGHDPLQERRRNAKQLLQDKTFDECLNAYLASHRNAWKSAKHAQQWKHSLCQYISPHLGKKEVRSIDTSHILQALVPIWTTRTETASRLRGRIERILSWATVSGYREGENPARWRGHLQELLPVPTKVKQPQHYPSMPYQDISAFFERLATCKERAARALSFTILTACRSTEALQARWCEIDFARAVWTIPAERMKNARPHRVPLSDFTLKLLRHQQGNDPVWVFPGLKPGKPLSSAAMLDLLRRMNTAVSVHGFRSTFRDWAAEKTNAPREVAEMALAHQTGSRVERAYMRSDLFERRRHLMDEWAAWCEKKPNVIDCLGQTSSVDPRQCLDIPVFLYQQQAVTHPEKSAVTGEDQHLGRNTLCTATSQSAEKNQ